MRSWQVELLKFLAEREGLLFGEFKLKSGRLSPYFFNLAKIISDGEGILKVSDFYVKGICDLIGGAKFNFIIGPAYKAIPLAAAISMLLYQKNNISVRWGYDRKEEKKYGVSAEKWFVGDLRRGDRILLVDDVATTGKTKIDLINKLKEGFADLYLKFQGVLILLDREELDDSGKYAGSILSECGVQLHSLLKVSEVFDYLRNREVDGRILVSEREYNLFSEYQERYGSSSRR